MARDKAVNELADGGDKRHAPISAPSPPSTPGLGKRSEDGTGPARPRAVRLEELDRRLETGLGNLGKVLSDFLIRPILDGVSGPRPPSLNPGPAELAIPVVDQKWPRAAHFRHFGTLPGHANRLSELAAGWTKRFAQGGPA